MSTEFAISDVDEEDPRCRERQLMELLALVLIHLSDAERGSRDDMTPRAVRLLRALWPESWAEDFHAVAAVFLGSLSRSSQAAAIGRLAVFWEREAEVDRARRRRQRAATLRDEKEAEERGTALEKFRQSQELQRLKYLEKKGLLSLWPRKAVVRPFVTAEMAAEDAAKEMANFDRALGL